MANLNKLREINLRETKEKLRNSVTPDLLIIQTINHIDDLVKVINMLSKDLREWYSYYNPEFSMEISDNLSFVDAIISKKDKKSKESLGGDFKKEDLKPIIELSEKIKELFILKENQENYLEISMNKIVPNMTAISGPIIGAKLLQLAGSLKKMMMMPSSTVQLLGAEEALFRHLKTGAKCPRHGVIVNHPLISKASQKDHGRIARLLASKISIAVKVDYGKGKFIGDKLLKEVEKKIDANKRIVKKTK